MPDMKDQLLNRIRAAANVSQAPPIDTGILNQLESQRPNRKTWLNPSFVAVTSLALIASATVIATPLMSNSTGQGAAIYYGENDTWPDTMERFEADWLLPWFGGSGTVYEIKVPKDFSTRLELVKTELPKEIPNQSSFDLLGSGEWYYHDDLALQEKGGVNNLPTEDVVRARANRIFTVSGFSGDLTTMKITITDEWISANCETLVEGKSVGISYQASWSRSGKLASASGWVATIIPHTDVPVMSPRETASTVSWRNFIGLDKFSNYRWDGNENPEKELVSYETDEISNLEDPENSRYKATHTVLTASSPSLAMARNRIGLKWIVPSYVYASGKTVVTNAPAVKELYLR